MPGNGAMKPLSLGLTDSRSLRKALKVLSSEDLLMLNEEIEAIALERIEEEEIKGVKASERGQVIDSFREKLALEGITPEELLAFTRDSPGTSKRKR
ncbi:H-NS family histone-like protein [Aeromonas rivipollensis]